MAAVAQEAENQKEELKKQRTNYVKKVSLLKKEMKVLKEQRNDLTAGDAPPSPTTKNFIEENDRLQVSQYDDIAIHAISFQIIILNLICRCKSKKNWTQLRTS